MSLRNPTLIAVYTDAPDDKQIEIAKMVADVVRKALALRDLENEDHYEVGVEIPAVNDQLPARVVQPREADRG